MLTRNTGAKRDGSRPLCELSLILTGITSGYTKQRPHSTGWGAVSIQLGEGYMTPTYASLVVGKVE